MREIKFRAWDKEEKVIFQVSELQFAKDKWHVHRSDIHWKYKGGDFSHSDYILMQYTGLKDKNGKEIYEGDIIKHGRHTDTVLWVSEADGWDICGFNFGWGEGCYNQQTTEVIGNIYENPELIKS